MPWIFLTLMLANIAYFGWNFIGASQVPARPVSMAIAQEGDRIQLLQERKEVPASATEEPAPAEAVVPEPVVEEKVVTVAQCFTVGAFQASAMAEQFAGRMRSKGLVTRIELRKAEGRDYWVYVPPFTSRAKAEERLRELKLRRVESFIVGEGAYVNAISLGHFSKKELAQDFLRKMTDAGIVAEYREMANKGTVSWVYVAPATAAADARKAIDAELAKKGELRKEVASCEE